MSAFAMGFRQAILSHLGSHQVARVIYGSIIGLALVVALEAHPPSAGFVAGSLIATAVAVAIAEVYSDIVGTETRTHRRVRGPELAHVLRDGMAVAIGVGFPAVFFFLAMADVLELDTAFTVAKWSGVGLVGFYGFAAARFAGVGLVGALLQASAVAVLGVAIIVVKSLLH
jgi:hypothetical protein